MISPETDLAGDGDGPTWNYANKAGESTANVSGACGARKDYGCQRANASGPQGPRWSWEPSARSDPTCCGPWISSSTRPPTDVTAKLLNIIDEFTREALATDVEHSITADMLVATLERLINLKGTPQYLRFDNGPEFVAGVVADWAKDRHVTLVFAEPGCPWQNGWVESFNGRLRDELLNGEQFATLLEAKVVIDD